MSDLCSTIDAECLHMQKKIIIAVAPTGGWGIGQDNPVAPEEIAEQAKACAEAGAAACTCMPGTQRVP